MNRSSVSATQLLESFEGKTFWTICPKIEGGERGVPVNPRPQH